MIFKKLLKFIYKLFEITYLEFHFENKTILLLRGYIFSIDVR
jgi:hypothetical protein